MTTETTDEDAARSRADDLPPPDESTLWLVSFADDDDREMRAPEIAQALRRGEIGADTIVWREGLPEWVALTTVPLLARLLVTSGETRAAPAVIGKIPLVQREEPAKPAEAAAAPVHAPTPADAPAPWELAGTAGRKRLETLSGVGEEATPSPRNAIDARASAATPAWKGRTRIGLPKMEEPLETTKVPPAAATGTPLPAAKSGGAATGTPLPGAKLAPTATGSPLPGARAAAVATGTPLPGAKVAAPASTQDATSQPAASLGPKPPATAASKSAFTPLEPKRPEARAIEPKAGAKSGLGAPRATVPKAAPAPTMKAVETAPKIAETPTPLAKSVEAPGASSPVAASEPSRAVAPADPVSSPIAVESSPEPDTAKTPALPSEPEPPTLPHSPPPQRVVAAPEPPKAASPEPPAARQMSRKLDAPKGPPLRHREPTQTSPSAPGARSAPPAARTGATNIWEDDDAAVSVDPESVRPPPPVHAIAEARAQGAPGFKKKIAPKPPSPKRPRSGAADSEEPTIPISTSPPAPDETPLFETPLFEAPKPVPIAALSVPSVEEFAKTPAIAPIDTTPTVPREAKPQTTSKPAEASTASVPPAPEKRGSLFPFALLGAAAAAVAIWFFLRKPPEPSVASTAESEHTAAAPEPTHAEVATATAAPTQPEQAAPSAEAPAETAPVVPATAAQQTTPSKPSNPTTAMDTSAAAPKEPKPTSTSKPETAVKPEPASKPESTSKPESAPKPEAEKPVAAVPAQPEVSDVGGEFDRSAAASALGAAAGVASGCRKPGDPTGVAVVHVTFANSGRATRALVEGPPFAGTPTGGCIADALRGAKVPPYGGDRVTVTKRVVIQ